MSVRGDHSSYPRRHESIPTRESKGFTGLEKLSFYCSSGCTSEVLGQHNSPQEAIMQKSHWCYKCAMYSICANMEEIIKGWRREIDFLRLTDNSFDNNQCIILI